MVKKIDNSFEEDNAIKIRGARQHNLKNIDLSLPRNKFIVFTGVSGSGKSSLAFDTIFAEGQRRYVESLSAYARQFLGQVDKPDVDNIEGLSPAISIDQKSTSHNPRSTVGTVTEVQDYLSDPSVIKSWQNATLPKMKFKGQSLKITDHNGSKNGKSKGGKSSQKINNYTAEQIRKIMYEGFALAKTISYLENNE